MAIGSKKLFLVRGKKKMLSNLVYIIKFFAQNALNYHSIKPSLFASFKSETADRISKTF